jgi:hypothetical protein
VVGDFNGDHRADLLCHSPFNGNKFMMLSHATGPLFTGTTYQTSLNNGWCTSRSNDDYATLAVSDLNGDGLADMFCHGNDGGGEWVDYTIPTEPIQYVPLGQSSITFARPWCSPRTGWTSPEVILADVDGDGRADVVCHDQSTGRVAVEYAPIAAVGTDIGCDPSPTGRYGCWMLGSERGPFGGFLVYQQRGSVWNLMPGAGMAIDVGPSGPWLVNDGGLIFQWTGSDWNPVPGGATDVGIGADGSVWIVGTTKIGNDYEVWRRDVPSWTKIPGGGIRIDVGPDGFPWLVNSNSQIFHWNGACERSSKGPSRILAFPSNGLRWAPPARLETSTGAAVGRLRGAS